MSEQPRVWHSGMFTLTDRGPEHYGALVLTYRPSEDARPVDLGPLVRAEAEQLAELLLAYLGATGEGGQPMKAFDERPTQCTAYGCARPVWNGYAMCRAHVEGHTPDDDALADDDRCAQCGQLRSGRAHDQTPGRRTWTHDFVEPARG